MPFVPRLFEDITRDMVTYMVSQNSLLTDFTPGSNVRTLLEAAAGELERELACPCR
ncbi:MAG: hypothetical protein NVSMB65_14340 [Chloroflexota bacterium]